MTSLTYTEQLAELARKAADLIEDPKRWTSGVMARGASGGAASARGGRAVCWCAWGALRVYAEKGDDARHIARTLAPHHFEGRWLADINDDDGHAAALFALRTIAQRYA